MSKGNMGTIEEGAKSGRLQDITVKSGVTMLEFCPYCRGRNRHHDKYLCLHANRAGVTKSELPNAYYVDMETGEVK